MIYNSKVVSEQLANCCRSICVNLSVCVGNLGICVWRLRRRVYRLAMSWDRIVELYTYACMVFLLVSLAWYYACVACTPLASLQPCDLLLTRAFRHLLIDDAD